jgi:hypothetical protein
MKFISSHCIQPSHLARSGLVSYLLICIGNEPLAAMSAMAAPTSSLGCSVTTLTNYEGLEPYHLVCRSLNQLKNGSKLPAMEYTHHLCSYLNFAARNLGLTYLPGEVVVLARQALEG